MSSIANVFRRHSATGLYNLNDDQVSALLKSKFGLTTQELFRRVESQSNSSSGTPANNFLAHVEDGKMLTVDYIGPHRGKEFTYDAANDTMMTTCKPGDQFRVDFTIGDTDDICLFQINPTNNTTGRKTWCRIAHIEAARTVLDGSEETDKGQSTSLDSPKPSQSGEGALFKVNRWRAHDDLSEE